MKILRITTAIIFILIIIAVLIYYYFTNPINGIGLQCWSKSLFNINCVSCGGQRALHHFLNGNFLEALKYNSFLVLFSPFLFFILYVFIRETILGIPTRSNILYSSLFGKIVIVLIVVFSILRNLPWYPFTLLAPPD